MAQVFHVANPIVASVGVIESVPQAESALVEPPNKPQLTRIQHANSRPIPGPGLSTSAVKRLPSQQNTGIPAVRSALGASAKTRPRAQNAPARPATAPVKPEPSKLVVPRLRARTGPTPAAAPWPTTKPRAASRPVAQTVLAPWPATKPPVAARQVQAPAVAQPTPKIAHQVPKSTAPAPRPRNQTLPIPAPATVLRPRPQAVSIPVPTTSGRPRAYRPSAPTPSRPVAAAGPVKATTAAPRTRSNRGQAVAAVEPGRPTTARARSVSGSSTSSTSSCRLLRF